MEKFLNLIYKLSKNVIFKIFLAISFLSGKNLIFLKKIIIYKKFLKLYFYRKVFKNFPNILFIQFFNLLPKIFFTFKSGKNYTCFY